MTQQVAIRGATLAVDDRGGDGPALIWGHGLTSSGAREDATGLFTWELPPGTRLIRYDARGHGRSQATPDPDGYRWDELARDQLALADALGVDRYVAAGASMGAATALHAAVLAPDRITALVLVIPPTAWETRAPQRAIYEGAADLVEGGGVQAWLDAIDQLPPPDLFADEPGLLRQPPDVTEAALPTVLRGAAASDFPPREAVTAIDRPVLVLAWETDPGHPVSSAEALAALLPQAEVHIAADLAAVRTWPATMLAFLRRC